MPSGSPPQRPVLPAGPSGPVPPVPSAPPTVLTGQVLPPANRMAGYPSGQYPVVPGAPSGQYPVVPGYAGPSGQYPVVPAGSRGAPRVAVAPAVAERRRRRAKRVLVTLIACVGALILAAGITFYVVYDRATAPDRSAPDVVVDNYLREFLVHRDDAAARKFRLLRSERS